MVAPQPYLSPPMCQVQEPLLERPQAHEGEASVSGYLTEKQLETLTHLRLYWAREGHAPSLRELGAVLDITQSSAYARLRVLKRLGRVTWEPDKGRTLRIVEA